MANENNNIWKTLEPTEEEESIIIADDPAEEDGNKESKYWLVGKLLTTKPFKDDDLTATMKLIWKTSREIEAVTVEKNFFLFKFRNNRDQARILEGSPLNFNRHMLLLHQFMSGWKPEEYEFLTPLFWLKIHDLPIGYRTKNTATKIGNNIGKLVALDQGLQTTGWGSYMRMRVEVNIRKPLRRFVTLGGKEGRGDIRGRITYK